MDPRVLTDGSSTSPWDTVGSLPGTRQPFLVLLGLAFAVAGCGAEHNSYDADTIVACLRGKGLGVAKDPANMFAPTSRNFVIEFPHGNVSLAFAPSEDAARNVEDRVRSVAQANGAADTNDVLRRNGNLVYWVNAQGFPAGLTKLVDGCL
jgi:hypothetical protein